MMNILNESDQFGRKQIAIIEEKYNAKFIMETCLCHGDGEWLNSPALIFYTEVAHPEGSNYFALYHNGKDLMVTNAYDTVIEPIAAVVADNGDVIYSRYRHDYRTSPDGSVFIDGGRNYTRTGMYEKNKYISIKVVRDKLQIVT